MPDDILHDFLTRLAQWAPPAEVTRVEAEMRQQWGGIKGVYVKKKDPPEIRCQALGLRLATGTGIADAFSDLGVSRATGYRLLSRRWRCR
jgi:hypothetical protein